MAAFMSAIASIMFFVLAVICMVVSVKEHERSHVFILTGLTMALAFFVIAIGLAKFGGW